MVRVNILSQGRFHMLDLARELAANGFDVKFYSFVPTKRAVSFGLPRECCVSMVVPLAPFLLIERLCKKLYWWRIKAQDLMMGLFMRKCDVCISLTGFLFAPRRAKHRGALVIFERGSKHILEQKRVLESIPGAKVPAVPARNVCWNLSGYALADYIAIATQHVRESFLKHDYPDEKLFVNPYGVDLSMFKPLEGAVKEYDVLMVGGWSYRKGCDLIVEAVRRMGCSFLHVGGLVDVPFPDEPNFTHVDPVDQHQLLAYYNKARVFVLPSREEGLAMVQAQAIACNLPLVGSPDSGAVDLKGMVAQGEYVTIIQSYTVDAVVEALGVALRQAEHLTEPYAGEAIEQLTWAAYGRRYAAFLRRVLG